MSPKKEVNHVVAGLMAREFGPDVLPSCGLKAKSPLEKGHWSYIIGTSDGLAAAGAAPDGSGYGFTAKKGSDLSWSVLPGKWISVKNESHGRISVAIGPLGAKVAQTVIDYLERWFPDGRE